jgi:hypothetical protein
VFFNTSQLFTFLQFWFWKFVTNTTCYRCV